MEADRLTAAVGIGCAVALSCLAGCGTQTRATPAEAAAVQERAAQLFMAISGDATDRDAAGFLINYGANLGLQQCMTRAGFSLSVTIVNDRHGWRATSGVSGSRFLDAPGAKLLSPGLLATADARRESAKAATARPHESPEYEARSDACAREEPPANWDNPLAEHDQSGVPDSAVKLQGEYLAMLADADEAAAGQGRDYVACMREHGYPDSNGYTDVVSELALDTPDAADIPLPGEDPSPAWLEFLDQEDLAARADAECRTEQYELSVLGLGTRLDEFEAEHADELSQVRRDWAATVDDATRYGFAPDEVVQVITPAP